MLNFPVLVIPQKYESWRIDGACRDYLIQGCTLQNRNSNALHVLGVQGTGIIKDTLIRNIADAEKVIANCSSGGDAVDLMANARGSLAIQLFSPVDQSVYLLNDPLGGAPIYHYHGSSCDAYSSDLGSLVSAIKMRGDRLTAEPKYFAAGVLTGTHSYGASTPFKEIESQRRGFGFRIDKLGQPSKIQILSSEHLYFSSETYEKGFDQLTSDICDNISIAARPTFDSRNSHLTAGFDSRLVLAAIVHLNLQDSFVFSCIENSSDWEIAKNVAGELNLLFSGSDGSPKGTGYALNYFESITRTARRSAGSIVAGIDPSLQPSNSLLFQGGYGEVGRTFNSFLWDGEETDIDKLAYLLWRYAGYPRVEERSSSIWANEFLDEVGSNVMSYFTEAKQLGLSKDFFSNYLYVEGRNRHWIGLQSFYASGVRSQLDPLYSKALVSTPRLLDFESRKSNFLGLDLMKLFSPELLALPFDRPRVGWLYEKSRGKVAKKQFNGIIPKIHSYNQPIAVKPWPGAVDQITEHEIAIGRDLGLSSLLIFGVKKYSNIALNLIGDNAELQRVYRIDSLTQRWNSGSPKSKDDYLTLHRVISALVLANLIR